MSVKKAIEEYLKESHNRMLKQYNLKHKDIEDLILKVDFKDLSKSNFTIKGEVIKGSPLDRNIQYLQEEFKKGLIKIIEKSMLQSYTSANTLFDTMIMKAYNTSIKLEPELFKHDSSVWSELKNRQLFEGRTLSGRIWTLSNSYKRDIVDALQIGFLNGDSADEIARRVARYSLYANEKILDIDKLTDAEVRAKIARKNTRKKGSLGTVLKDAKRLAGNETNIAYREAENANMEAYYVLGFEIHLSNAHPRVDICDFVNGKYPKWFKWNGWHPSCLCYRTYILMPYEERLMNSRRIKEGKKPIIKGLITDVPEGFKQYMKDNYDKMSKWESKPYFMVDNDVSKLF